MLIAFHDLHSKMKLNPAGNTSLAATPVAVMVPVLVRASVSVTFELTGGDSVFAVSARARSITCGVRTRRF
jgi:hypothetical protein